jgi:hypothetical protein
MLFVLLCIYTLFSGEGLKKKASYHGFNRIGFIEKAACHLIPEALVWRRITL